jgi:multidrug efflux pump subunit AcrA (membrane-fusion protein)
MNKFLNKDLEEYSAQGKLEAVSHIYRIEKKSFLHKWLYGFLGLMVLAVFLPWTQNIRSKGYVTTINQQDRPQEINAIIPGKVEKWFVKEGDFVKKGDVIVQLGEVKVEYFDPQLFERTRQQILAKMESRNAYDQKAGTSDNQIAALSSARNFKMQSLDNKISQQYLKIKTDSIDLIAIRNAVNAYQRQFVAAKVMLDSGAISLTEYEKRRVLLQDAYAKEQGTVNKFNQNTQELLNLKIEKNGIGQEYLDKISKAEGDRFGSVSSAMNSTAEVLKLENQLANYDARQQLFIVRATQSGQIINAVKAGIGEMIKEGDMIAEIVPDNANKAIELFIEPVDLPLIAIGQDVRFVFDGFPAILFSGWPTGSYGTFAGKVSAIEGSASKNGKFRILVIENPKDKAWPKSLKLGGGANGIALLKDVPIYYELWRNINGFPPDFYNETEMPAK